MYRIKMAEILFQYSRGTDHWKVIDFRLIAETISLGMPIIYNILDKVLVFFLRDVARYRFQVIRQNLRSSFNYSSDKELNKAMTANYRFLARTIRETLWRPSPKNLNKRVIIKPLPKIREWLSGGKSVIVMMSHAGNWEWAAIRVAVDYPEEISALYRKIKSGVLNRLMIRRRNVTTGYLIDSGDVSELI